MVAKTPDFDKLFNPQSIAIVGVSSQLFQFGGTSFLQRLQEVGYPGRLYPINPKADVIRGLQCYPDLTSLPEVPDLAIVCIPASIVPEVLETCGQIGLTHIHILTSGFKELGTPEGVRLEDAIFSIAKRCDLKVVGPNCMGPYSPSARLTAWGGIPGMDGLIGVISQSGGITQRFTELTCSLGIGVAKAVSIGNATVLDAGDFLEYMAEDNQIKVIALYLEDVREGRRFLRLLGQINQKKPVVVLKGGNSDAGNRTIASHTGSMMGNQEIWDAVFKQTGSVRVRSLHEWVDAVMALSLLPETVSGNGVFLATGGGGNSIIYGDVFSQEGLDVPELSGKAMEQLRQKVPALGSIAGNPLDSFEIFANPAHIRDVAGIVMDEPNIAMMVVDRLIPRKAYHLPDLPDQTRAAIEILKPVSRKKPTVVTVDSSGGDMTLAKQGTNMRKAFCEKGIPAYPSPERAARALSLYHRYHCFKARKHL
jgi:acyl-CoA synthetase (NDP forming)